MALTRKSTTKIYEVQAHTPKTTCLDIGATGRVLVTGGQDRYIKLWTFENNENIMSLKGHTSVVDLVKFAYNDDFVYSADDNGIIKKWNLNTGQETTSLYGHMKTVRALHFHPFGDYVVSGSHDTTLRLWDIRVDSCIKRYRGHISTVNSVKFSPDGTWIASAGNEGALIIWDIRMSNKSIVEFNDHSSSILCIQYHPFEFLLAAGRSDGTVDFYDLEKRAMISSGENSRPRARQGVKCITFNEDGNCLFAGTTDSVAVIGWEPDKEYDSVEGTWTGIGDMKVLNRQILCGAYENNTASIHGIGIDQLMPFFNPSNVPFSHNQGSRKSFSNRTGKLRLSIGNNSSKLNVPPTEEENEQSFMSGDGQSSPNLSIEMIDDDPMEAVKINYPLKKSDTFDKKTKNSSDSFQIDKYMKTHTNGKTDNYRNYINDYSSDLDYFPVRSSPLLPNVVEPEREDFPVNNAQPPDYAPKLNTMTITKTVVRQKVDVRRGSSNNGSLQNHPSTNRTQTGHGGLLYNKKNNMASISTTDLNKIDDNQNVTVRRPISRGGSPVRSFNSTNHHHTTKLKKSESITQFNRDRDSNKTKNIPVHIITKPQPVARSKTNIDLRAAAVGSPVPHTTPSKIPNYVSDLTNEHHEIQLMTTCHESIYQALRNRHTSLQLIRTMRSTDSNSIIKNTVQINDPGVLVDILGAITEKSIPLNLDSCVVLLPEIYELLKSEYKFHNMRACDILRTILKTFLPTIRANLDQYSPARALGGVDITREERQRKCLTCREWLLRIRCLPENDKLGSTFTQLQNMITDL